MTEKERRHGHSKLWLRERYLSQISGMVQIEPDYEKRAGSGGMYKEVKSAHSQNGWVIWESETLRKGQRSSGAGEV